MRHLALAALLTTALFAAAAASARGQANPLGSIPKPHIDQPALDKLGWRLGCQAWTFRKLTLFETLDLLNALGIRYIELYPGQALSPEHKDVKFDHNASAEYVEQVIQKLKDTNVTAVSYGVVDLGKDEASARKVFDFAKKLGLENVVAEPAEKSFDMLDKLTGEYSINLAIHDHPKPSHYWNPDSVLKVVEGRSKRIGSCADVGHWYRSGLVPVECIKKLQGRIIESHFKDVDENKEDVVWGTGKVDIKGCLEELKRQGAKPLFAIEYEKGEGEELIGNVSKSIDQFSAMVAELAK